LTMPSERVVEIPWALAQLPQNGVILDVGSCEAIYLPIIAQPGRVLHCLDPRDCAAEIPGDAIFYHQSIIGNTLPGNYYDAVLALSTIEHIGLPHYDQKPFPDGDTLTLSEIARLLKPAGRAVITVPAGQSKVMSWYRQYSPPDLQRLLAGWQARVTYWGFNGVEYVLIEEAQVETYDYFDRNNAHQRAGAIAGIVCTKAR
jgi:hypothetical protein